MTGFEATGVSRRGLLVGASAGVAAGALGTLGTQGAAVAAVAAPSTPVRKAPVGFVLSHEQFASQALVQWAARADAAGFGYVWTSDHFQPWQDNQGHSMHPWLTLALISQATRAVTFGTGVTCPIYRHHPSEVAQTWASLSRLAPGRVFLGVGTGEALNEKAATGSFGPYAERAARLDEAITVIRGLWSGQRFSFKGTYYTVDSAQLYDEPVTDVPLYVAASGPKSAYLAGRRGDGWICGAKDLQKPELRAAFARGARDAGKDPDAMPKLVEQFVVVGGPGDVSYAADRWRFTYDAYGDLLYEPNPVVIQQKARARWSKAQVSADWPQGEDPAVHIAAVQKLLDLGATPMIHSGQRDQPKVIDFYARHVLGRVHR